MNNESLSESRKDTNPQTELETQSGTAMETDPLTCCDKPERDSGPQKPKQGSHVFAIVIGLLILLLFTSPWTLDWIRGVGSKARHAEREYLGVVQKITYVGGFGTNTQIEADSQTLLLRGAVELKKGARLERRESLFDIQVCELETGACWDLMGR